MFWKKPKTYSFQEYFNKDKDSKIVKDATSKTIIKQEVKEPNESKITVSKKENTNNTRKTVIVNAFKSDKKVEKHLNNNEATSIKKENKVSIKENKKSEKSLKNKFETTKQKLKEHRKLQNEIGKLINEWQEVMVNKKYYNEGFLTLTLAHIKKEEFGWSARVYSPYGGALEDLDRLVPSIESGLKCKFMFNIPEHNEFAMCKIIYSKQIKCNAIPFQPAKVKPYEIFIGIDITGQKIILSVNDTPHILIAGQTRKGKNASGDHFLTSLIHSCSPQELELYLFQCAKNDLIKYANCEQVKSFVLHDFKKMESDLEKLLKEIDRRLELLKPMVISLKGDNLYDYNKLNPKNKLPYTYVVIDEFMVLTLPTKDKEISNIKQHILSMLEYIGEMGGSVGVNYAIFHQKPSKDLCPTFIKNMSLIRVCFGFDDESCGRIVLGEKYGDLALKLPARRAYYSADGKIDLMFTTNLREEDGSSRIKQFIQGSIKIKNNIINKRDKKENESISKNIDVKSIDKENIEPLTNRNKGTTLLPIKNASKNISKQISKELNIELDNNQVPENNESNKKTIPFSLINKENKINEFKINNIVPQTSMEFNKVDPIKISIDKEKLMENIKKIENFVPYNPNKNITIIDKTKFNPSKTQKPIKNKKGDAE